MTFQFRKVSKVKRYALTTQDVGRGISGMAGGGAGGSGLARLLDVGTPHLISQMNTQDTSQSLEQFLQRSGSLHQVAADGSATHAFRLKHLDAL